MKFSAILVLGAAVLSTAATTRDACAVTIVHSNDVLGELEPCGCRTNPLGGYPRKANLLNAVTQDAKNPGEELIQVDAGDLFYPSNVIPDLLKQQSLIQATYNLKTLSMLHHDVIVPGEKDFALGTKSLLKLASGSKIHFLAANLRTKAGKSPFPPSVILTRRTTEGKTLRVALIGLLGSDLEWPNDLKVSSPISAAKKLIPELRKKADFVIAVTHEGLEADQSLAESVPGIDLIIGGHTQSFLQNPEKVKSTTIFQSSFRNQYVGLINLASYAKTHNPEDYYRLVALDANYDSPASAPGPVDHLVNEFKTEIARVNTESDQVVPANSSHGKFQTFPRCAECHLKQFDFWRKTPHMNALHALVEAKQDKNKECLTCHTVGLGDPQGVNSVLQLAQVKTAPEASPVFLSNEEFVRYLKDVHDAGSISDELPKIPQSMNPAPKVRVDASLNQFAQAWTPVQCENCHGAGREHPFNGEMTKKVENATCMACHTQSRAPEWYTKDGKPNWDKINEKHAQMACPSGDLILDN